MSTYSSAYTIRTVASREIQVALRSKGITITLVVLLILLVGGVGILSWQKGKEKSPTTLAVAENYVDAFATTEFEIVRVADRAAAEDTVRSGDADAAVAAGDTGWDVLFDGVPDAAVLNLVGEVVGTQATSEALNTLGIPLDEFTAAMPAIDMHPVNISDSDGGSMTSLLTALAGIMIVAFTVTLFAANIGARITEEKASRVVEIILASVRPMDFLAGKIVGNVIVGFVSTTMLLGAGVGALVISGLFDDVSFDWSILPMLMVTWFLGMLLFGSLYAAAGAMVQRTEDLQSTQSPVMILVMLSIYIPMFGWTHTDATWMQVFSWLPPTSIFSAPVTYAAGDFSTVELALSYALALLTTLLVIWGISRIYRNTILNNGRKLGWLQALRV